MISTRHTPGCVGHESPYLCATDQNQRIGDNCFQYVRCESCGLIRLAEVPDDLKKHYPPGYYTIPTFEQLTELAHKDFFKVETLRRYSRPGRLLEIGPAWGTFALQAKQAGYQVDAIEMDPRCCEYLNQTVGVRAICSSVPHEAIYSLGSHEVIALWHVLEHLPDPWALLEATANNLTPGGVLMLATPNPGAWQFHVMGSAWPHIDAPRHLYLFPSDTLIRYSAQFGLELVQHSTTDHDAKSWNRFGWQRLLMNRVRGKWLNRIAFLAGYGIATLVASIENREPNGSALTLVLRKSVGS